MIDYCPNCGANSDWLDSYMNGDTYCNNCGCTHNEEEGKESEESEI